uniref:Uncharacterized protein n=1 Tax=Siphoviridae sp. ctEw721 TaxID=2825400 RepID=A0A8S5TS21_9CAUD|nr:MAG TPA: hypothetical protein [Siphoviridae sp. ctEw721]
MSEIDKKTRADLFRKRIEDKNTLTGAGAIYVGTGKKTEIPGTQMTVGNAEVTGAYYETIGVAPTAVGQVPVSVSGTGTAGVAGLAFKSVNDAMKGENGSILLAANGMIVRSSNGITFLNEDAVNTDISITNKMRDISVNAAQNVSIEGGTKTKISNISLDTTLNGPLTGNLYTAPSGTPSLSTTGVTNAYSSDTSEKNLVPILYNVGQRLSSAEERLNSLGFKKLGGDLDSAFEFELKKSYTSEGGVSTTFTLGTLKIAPQDVMGNYCRAVVKFEPEPVFDNSSGKVLPMRLKATDYPHASDDNQRRLLFYFDDYFLTRNGEILYDKEASSSITTKSMSKIQNVSVAPNEKVSFYYSFPINLYQNIEDTQPAAYTLVTVYFTLSPDTGDKARVQMEIHSQNYSGLVTHNKYAVLIPGEADVRTYPIIAYKRKI